jgi:hypothetical protein
MKTSTVIHIGTVNMHVPSPSTLLHSDHLARRVGLAEALMSIEEPIGTVVDQTTGLMWSKGTIAKGKTWAQAKEAAEALSLGGCSDWRLPTRKELLTLVDDTRSKPAIDTDKFECDSDWYWSSTPLASSPSDCAWGVLFSVGGAFYNGQGYSGRVRAVRSVSPSASGQ